MKKILIVLLLIFVASLGSIYAHEHHHNDSTKMSTADSLMQIEMSEHQQMEAVNAFPNYHPLIVHFPIVLLLLAAVFQLLSFFYSPKQLNIVTLILLILGVVSA